MDNQAITTGDILIIMTIIIIVIVTLIGIYGIRATQTPLPF